MYVCILTVAAWFCYTFLAANETPKIPTDREIMELSSQLGQEWKTLGTYLGLSHHQIDNINLDHRRTQDKIVAMLTAWRETVGKEAYQVLSKELKSCHRMDLAKKVEGNLFSFLIEILLNMTRPK